MHVLAYVLYVSMCMYVQTGMYEYVCTYYIYINCVYVYIYIYIIYICIYTHRKHICMISYCLRESCRRIVKIIAQDDPMLRRGGQEQVRSSSCIQIFAPRWSFPLVCTHMYIQQCMIDKCTHVTTIIITMAIIVIRYL